MDRVFKRRKGSINLIQLFELSQKGRLYTCQLVHKVFIPEVIYSARNGLLMPFFFPGVLHIMSYMGRLRAKGVPFLGFRYSKEQRFHQLKYMKGQENTSFRSVKRSKRTRLAITFIFHSKKTYFAQQDLIPSFTFIVTSESL